MSSYILILGIFFSECNLSMQIMYRKTSFDFSFFPILLASRLENVFCFMTLGHFIKEIKLRCTTAHWCSSFHNLIWKKTSLWQKSGSSMLNVTTVSRSNKVKIKQREAIHNLPVGLMTVLWQVWVNKHWEWRKTTNEAGLRLILSNPTRLTEYETYYNAGI